MVNVSPAQPQRAVSPEGPSAGATIAWPGQAIGIASMPEFRGEEIDLLRHQRVAAPGFDRLGQRLARA